MRSSRDNLISVTEEIIKAIKLKTDDVNIGNIVVLPATDDVGDMRVLEELQKPRVSVSGCRLVSQAFIRHHSIQCLLIPPPPRN